MVLRQKLLIDVDVQGALIGRVLIYWAVGLIYVALGSVCFQYYQEPEWTLSEHAQRLLSDFWPWLPSALLFLPLVIYDVVRLSNRFAGPIFRLRRHLGLLNKDSNCGSLVFRSEDFWRDIITPVNQLQAQIQHLEAQVVALESSMEQATEQLAIMHPQAKPDRLAGDQGQAEFPEDAVAEAADVPSPERKKRFPTTLPSPAEVDAVDAADLGDSDTASLAEMPPEERLAGSVLQAASDAPREIPLGVETQSSARRS